MNDMVDVLVSTVDESTQQMRHDKILKLFGDPSSRYLRGIQQKAHKLGIEVSWNADAPDIYFDGPVVVDKETVDRIPKIPDSRLDLDCMQYDGMSCTAEAVGALTQVILPKRGTVCIVGRGHAVKGLAQSLLNLNYTVSVCHSNTKNLFDVSGCADIIVNGAPLSDPFSVLVRPGTIIMDISGSLSFYQDIEAVRYISSREIGRLNTSILLNRCARR